MKPTNRSKALSARWFALGLFAAAAAGAASVLGTHLLYVNHMDWQPILAGVLLALPLVGAVGLGLCAWMASGVRRRAMLAICAGLLAGGVLIAGWAMSSPNRCLSLRNLVGARRPVVFVNDSRFVVQYPCPPLMEEQKGDIGRSGGTDPIGVKMMEQHNEP